MGVQGSILRPNVATMRSWIKFMVASESIRAAIVEKRLVRKTDRETRLDEKQDTKVRIQVVRKLLTS